jgi:thioredoxin-dependent peroxiredoxin
MPSPGEMMPEIELLNQDGKTVKLSDFHGRKVILFAFPKANTSGCTTQACGFRDALPQVTTSNAVVFGISPDQPAELLSWKQQENLPYDLLSDPDHTILEQLGAWGEKSMYGKTYTGVIRSHWVIGEDGRVIDEQLKVSPTDSVERALKTVGG